MTTSAITLPPLQPFAMGFGHQPGDPTEPSKAFLRVVALMARQPLRIGQARPIFAQRSAPPPSEDGPARFESARTPATEQISEFVLVRRAGDLSDLAAVLDVNQEALRRLVKGELDSGRRIPGVGRVGRKYRVMIEAFLDAWRRGEVSLKGWKPE